MSRNSDSLLRKEVECDLGFASGNEVRQRLRRTAGQGPAERAVTGIEKQLGQPRAADDRHVVRRRRPQARPPLHYRYSAETGKQLPDPPHDRIATDRVDGSVVASELRGPPGAQAVVSRPGPNLGGSSGLCSPRAGCDVPPNGRVATSRG